MNGWFPPIRVEQAMLVIVLLGSVFVALGFVSISAYYEAMGFPSALFPPELAMLGPMGFFSGIPAILIIAVIPLIAFSGWKFGATPWFRRNIVDRVKQNKILQWLLLILAIAIASIYPVISYFGTERPELVTLTLLLVFSFGTVIANTPHGTSSGTGQWGISSWLMLIVFIYLVSFPVTQCTAGIAAALGRWTVAEILKEKEPRFPTVIPLSGEPYKPGKLIVCSERFCGFHNGRCPKIVSLDGIREIVP